MCKTQMVSELNTECTSASDDSFLLTMDNISSKNSDTWTIDLTVNNIPIKFKIDTGADVTAIPPKEFSKLKGTMIPFFLPWTTYLQKTVILGPLTSQ